MHRMGVVGCGVMGAGIAEIGAKGGCDVIVVDAFPEALDRAKGRLAASLAPSIWQLEEAGTHASLFPRSSRHAACATGTCLSAEPSPCPAGTAEAGTGPPPVA